MTEAVHEWTLDELEWHPYLSPIDFGEATPEQRDALKETPSGRKVSAYLLTLAHDPEILRERSPLFNDIMYSRGGLSRAERELGALAASVVNRCIYCASVHAGRYNVLAKRPEIVEAIYADETEAELPSREQALFNFGVELTRRPGEIGPDHLASLREAGLSDFEIFDLIHAVAIFGWANRLMHTLGEPHRKV
jgi:uncharacterized peroxidase-related enzyme